MTDQERLEEIKAQYHILTRNGYDLGAWDEPFSWLIERVQELENIIYQDARQGVLEGLYEENKKLREALEEIKKEEAVTTGLSNGQVAYTMSGHIARKALEESE